MRRISAFFVIFAVLITMTGCQSTADPPFYGEYFGRDLDECYEAWGIDPETDIEVFYDDQYFVFFNAPTEYLGKEFNVRFGYVTQRKNTPFQNNKFTNITYEREYNDVSDEEIAKDVAALFDTIFEEFGKTGEMITASYAHQLDDGSITSNITLEPDFTEDNIADMLAVRESAKGDNIFFVAMSEWHLPEEYKKVDADFVEQFEEFSGRDGTYCVECNLEYNEGRFVFSVRHGFDFADKYR